MGLFSRSASIVIMFGYFARFMPNSKPLVCPSLVFEIAKSACFFAMSRVPSFELSSTTIISCAMPSRAVFTCWISSSMFSASFHVVVTTEIPRADKCGHSWISFIDWNYNFIV